MTQAEKFRIYIAVYLALIKDGQVLLLKRKNTGYQDGNYSLVSGHMEGREPAKQSIIREAKEEAGVELRPEDLEVVHVMHRLAPEREYIDVYLQTSIWSGEIKNLEPNKCAELAWYPLNQLPSNIIPEVKLALENIENGVHYSEFGWPV